MPSDMSGENQQEKPADAGIQQLPLLPFAVQLQNIVPVEIVAKRFPVNFDAASVGVISPSTNLNLAEIAINTEMRHAQVSLEVQVEFPAEPQLFEIYFKLIGSFTYTQEYSPETVQQYLQQGSLSVMLPSARELLLSLCTRLQVPMIVLPLIQLAPFPDTDTMDDPE